MKKKLTLLLLFLITSAFLILAADESKRPLIITGDNLRRDSGSVDGSTISINTDSSYTGRLAYTWNYMLEKGNYTLGVEYRTDTSDNTLYVRSNGTNALTYNLNPSYTYQELPFSLAGDSQDIRIEIYYNGTGVLSVTSLQLTPEGRFYNDAYFFVALLIFLCIGGFLLLRCRFFSTMSKESKMILFALAAAAAASSVPYFNGYLNWADDLCYHLIRIEGIKDGLLDGQFPVVIYPEGLYGNGYLNCMYPNLFLYIPALFRILGVSMANSFKVFMFLFQLLTAFLTYHSVKSISASRKAALLATILYMLCPYRFTNAYARGAVGEFLAMAFLPPLFAGLYHVLLGERKNWWMLALSISGLIQTHVLSAVLGGIFCVLLGILCIVPVIREKRFPEILKAALVTVLLNLWFIVPFLYFYKDGNLWTDSLDWCRFSEYSLNLSGLPGTINPADYRMLTLGLPVVFCGVICLFSVLFEKKTDRLHRYLVYLFVSGCVCTYMTVSQFPGWSLMEIKPIAFLLKNMQFAWRMLAPASVLLVLAGCIFLYRSESLMPYRRGIFLLLSGIAVLSVSHYQADDFAYKNYYDTFTVGHESKLRGIPRGDNTIIYPFEWRPEGTVDAELSTEPVFSDSSAIKVQDFIKDGTSLTLTYSCTREGVAVSLPLLYYAGYAAADETGQPLALTPDPENNTIRTSLTGDGQTHQIIVKYKGLKRFTAAFLISLASAGAWGFFVYRSHCVKRVPEAGAGNPPAAPEV